MGLCLYVAFMHHPYLVCILFGMPSIFLHFYFLVSICTFLMSISKLLLIYSFKCTSNHNPRTWNSIDSVVEVPSMYKQVVVTYNCQLEPDEGPTTLYGTSLRSELIFCHMHDNRQLTTLALLELRVVKCSALPRWCAQQKPWPLLREGRESRDCASRTPRPSLRQRKI